MKTSKFGILLSLFVFASAVPVARAATFNVDTIAFTGVDNARGPGLGAGVTYNNLANVTYGPNGAIAYRGDLTGGSALRGIFSGVGTSVNPFLLTSDAAPGVPGATFSSVNPNGFFSDGSLLYSGQLSGPGITTANDAVTYLPGGTAPFLRENDPAPGLLGVTVRTPGGVVAGDQVALGLQIAGIGVNSSNDRVLFVGFTFAQIMREGSGGINDDLNPNEFFASSQVVRPSRGGNLIFESQVNEAIGNTEVGHGVFSWDGSMIKTLARTGGPAADIPGATYSESPQFRDIHVSGDLAFVTTVSEPGEPDGRGIFRISGDDVSLIARVGDAAPGLPGEEFIEVGVSSQSVRLGSDGIVGFSALTGPLSSGWFLQRGDQDFALTVTGDTSLPGLLPGESIIGPSTDSALIVSDNGAVVFSAGISGSVSGAGGLWYYGLDNQHHYLLRRGEIFDTDPTAGVDERTIASFDLALSSEFVDDRTFTLFLGFSDGSEGLFQFSTVPEPASLALVALAALPLVALRRRRRL